MAIGLGLWAFAPREPVERGGPVDVIADVAGFYPAREAAFDDIVPGAEARIIGAGEPGRVAPWTVVNLHGFSASSEDIRPVPDRVPEALGANLVFAPLTGHARDGAALADARAGDWIDDTAVALQIARQIGDRVLVIGTSTSATLAAYAAGEPDMAEGWRGS